MTTLTQQCYTDDGRKKKDAGSESKSCRILPVWPLNRWKPGQDSEWFANCGLRKGGGGLQTSRHAGDDSLAFGVVGVSDKREQRQ